LKSYVCNEVLSVVINCLIPKFRLVTCSSRLFSLSTRGGKNTEAAVYELALSGRWGQTFPERVMIKSRSNQNFYLATTYSTCLRFCLDFSADNLSHLRSIVNLRETVGQRNWTPSVLDCQQLLCCIMSWRRHTEGVAGHWRFHTLSQ